MLAVFCIVGAIVLVSVGLGIVEMRRRTPLAYRCRRCGAEFAQPPHRDFPRECPNCHARDWAT
jgi:hypothetical protein